MSKSYKEIWIPLEDNIKFLSDISLNMLDYLLDCWEHDNVPSEIKIADFCEELERNGVDVYHEPC